MKNTTKKIIIILAVAAAAVLAILATSGTAAAKDVWYSTEEQQRINQRMDYLQKQIDELKGINSQLEEMVGQPAQIQIKEIIREPDNTRVAALEGRVSALESAVSFIQDKVMKAITTTIGLLNQIILRWKN